MEHVPDGDPLARPTSERTATLLAEIASILRVDPIIFLDGRIRESVGRDLAADDLVELLALFRSIDAPYVREAARGLIRTLRRDEDRED